MLKNYTSEDIIRNAFITMNNPVSCINDFPGVGKFNRFIFLQDPAHRFANDLKISFNGTSCFQIGFRTRWLISQKAFNFLNSCKNIVKPCFDFNVHTEAVVAD